MVNKAVLFGVLPASILAGGAVYLVCTTGSLDGAGWLLFVAWLVMPNEITVRG